MTTQPNDTATLTDLLAENARLKEQLQRHRQESETLYRVGHALISTVDLDQLLYLIVQAAVNTIPHSKNCVLHLLEEESGLLIPKALSFMGVVHANEAGRSRMRIGQGVAGVALERGVIVNIPDVSQDPRFVRVGEVRAFASMMVIPLLLGERRIGTMSIDSLEVNAFSPDDERLMSTLATQAAVAIENARLIQDLQKSLADLRSTQAQLIQSEKLSAIGQLIAGVAHELNNPLTAIMGYAQLLQTSTEVNEETLRDLDKIYLQAQRAARIVQNLLTFARQHKAEREPVDVNDVLQRTLDLRSYQLRVENIEVTTELAKRDLTTLAEANQLQQVFLNLINNAQDAMTTFRGSGKLKILTGVRDDMIWVKVSDNGPGIPSQVQKHLFEPFFTTKEVGKGTGLGLSICFGIVSQYSGRIWAESTEGQGATFVVELPLESGDPALWVKATETPAPQFTNRSVLVVEDEENISGLMERILTQDGHQVLIAADGYKAIEILAHARQQGTRFDLIISDIKMPGLNGQALYERIRKDDPLLVERLVFTTGDTMSPSTLSFLQRVGRPYITKPFTVNDLHRVMAEVLGEAVAAG